ncbi:MAG: thioredoxin family protein [Candidatus Heimdallarchaeota archaeon]|nr:thioredoxin family protein [Candidatus Heimdallarchaeota archaeon]
MAKEILFIVAPLCPRCVRVNRWLKRLVKTHPEITVRKLNVVTHFRETKKYKLRTVPTLFIGKKRLEGWIKEEEFTTAVRDFLK